MTTWNSNRTKSGTKGRDYMLGSFFATVLTAITDDKDGKALQIKCDPAYPKSNSWKTRRETKVTYKSNK